MNNLHIPILTLIDRVNKMQGDYADAQKWEHYVRGQANLRHIQDELKLILEEVKTYVKEKENEEELKKKRDGLSKTKKQKEDQCKELKNKIKQRLRDEWPELANIHHPKVDSIKSLNNGAKLISLVNHQNQWNNLRKLKNEISEIANERFILEKNQVLAMRLKFEIENIVLSEALNNIASPKIIERYKEIEKLEKTTFEF